MEEKLSKETYMRMIRSYSITVWLWIIGVCLQSVAGVGIFIKKGFGVSFIMSSILILLYIMCAFMFRATKISYQKEMHKHYPESKEGD